MLERRHHQRRRVYYGGRIAFHRRTASIDCIVRNFSSDGAKVQLECPAVVPDLVDLTIARKGVAFLARVVWRRADEAGLVLHSPRTVEPELPLDIALRIRATERANQSLRNQIEQLRSEH
jgi:hypothetical protein